MANLAFLSPSARGVSTRGRAILDAGWHTGGKIKSFLNVGQTGKIRENPGQVLPHGPNLTTKAPRTPRIAGPSSGWWLSPGRFFFWLRYVITGDNT